MLLAGLLILITTNPVVTTIFSFLMVQLFISTRVEPEKSSVIPVYSDLCLIDMFIFFSSLAFNWLKRMRFPAEQ